MSFSQASAQAQWWWCCRKEGGLCALPHWSHACSLKFKTWSADAASDRTALIMIVTGEAIIVNNYKVSDILYKKSSCALKPFYF